MILYLAHAKSKTIRIFLYIKVALRYVKFSMVI